MKHKVTRKLDEERSRYIGDRFTKIIQTIDYWADLCAKYILLTNAGGAVVILAFMSASSCVRNMIGLKLAL
jgi:hypothetical protein